jgi:hypothetical protein
LFVVAGPRSFHKGEEIVMLVGRTADVQVFGRRDDDPSGALSAGVRKAPRHEIAGCWAAAVRRMLWGFRHRGWYSGLNGSDWRARFAIKHGRGHRFERAMCAQSDRLGGAASESSEQMRALARPAGSKQE